MYKYHLLFRKIMNAFQIVMFLLYNLINSEELETLRSVPDEQLKARLFAFPAAGGLSVTSTGSTPAAVAADKSRPQSPAAASPAAAGGESLDRRCLDELRELLSALGAELERSEPSTESAAAADAAPSGTHYVAAMIRRYREAERALLAKLIARVQRILTPI